MVVWNGVGGVDVREWMDNRGRHVKGQHLFQQMERERTHELNGMRDPVLVIETLRPQGSNRLLEASLGKEKTN